MPKTIEDFVEHLQSMSKEEIDRYRHRRQPMPLFDFALCVGLGELKETIRQINNSGWILVSVTQQEEAYTVFFGRPR